MPVRDIAEHAQTEYDLIIVATLEVPTQQLAALSQKGVALEKLFPLRREPQAERTRPANDRGRTGNGKLG